MVMPRQAESAIKLAPSILSANAVRLAEEVHEAEQGGADRIHVDVMDGHFVPNLTFGPVIVKWLRPVTQLPLEVHLMIDNPDRFVEAFAEAGANTLIVHQEGAIHLNRTVQQIKALGCRAGVAINPATPALMLEEILPDLDLVLVMTVNPGFGGQHFLSGTLSKIGTIRKMIDSLGTPCELEVDGGIDHETAPLVVGAGARVLVAGSSIYGAEDGVSAAMARLRDLEEAGEPAFIVRPGQTTVPCDSVLWTLPLAPGSRQHRRA